MNDPTSRLAHAPCIMIPWPRDPRQWPLPGFTHQHGYAGVRLAIAASTPTRPRPAPVITYRILPRLQMRLDFLWITDPTLHPRQPAKGD